METYSVPPEDEGSRIDVWLAGRLANHSRTELQRWIREGRVTVDGLACKPSTQLEAGQKIIVDTPPAPDELTARPQAIPLDILYEDSDLVVVNKPSGMVVHPAPGHRHDTLVNAVLHHCPDIQGIGGEMRPGIVHRLDKETSGLIVVAKNDAALRRLQAQFKARTVHKEYTALLEGQIQPPSGRINVPLGRHPTARKRQAAYPPGTTGADTKAREAVTDYDTAAHYWTPASLSGSPASFTLVAARPHTGRTHQLRVHFAWMKHPIVGDTVYGYRKQRLPVRRLFLHAREISFELPSSQNQVTFTAPLPSELQELLDRLGRG